MDKPQMLKRWDDLWTNYTWWPAISQSFADLTAEQAAWKPHPDRNSIWQLLNHIAFWQDVTVGRLDGNQPADDEITRRNFEEPTDRSEIAWKASRQRLQDSHGTVRSAIESGKLPEDKLDNLVGHAAYHLGQVMYLRALQGLPAIGY